MSRLHSFLTDSRVLSAIGVASLSAIVLLGARALQLAMVWALSPPESACRRMCEITYI